MRSILNVFNICILNSDSDASLFYRTFISTTLGLRIMDALNHFIFCGEMLSKAALVIPTKKMNLQMRK